MAERIIPESELIINPDGSVFHLHLRPEQLTDRIILVGDPARVDMVASFFDSRTFEVQAREFHTIGGTYKGKPIMCLSHGIGPDNIDIVVTELDALANVDFATRQVRDNKRRLTILKTLSATIRGGIPCGRVRMWLMPTRSLSARLAVTTWCAAILFRP